MLKISDKAFSYLNSLEIPDLNNLSENIENKILKKESKARGFHKKQRWNRSLTAIKKCNFNTILAVLDGKIILKEEIERYGDAMVYKDPKLNLAIVFESNTDISVARRRCRDNVKLKIVKNVETEYFKHITDFLNCGNYKILLVSTQNLQKDEEIFISPTFFKRSAEEKDICTCSREELCLYNNPCDG